MDGEILLRMLPTTLLQIFRDFTLYSKVRVKSIRDPEDNFSRNSSINGLNAMSDCMRELWCTRCDRNGGRIMSPALPFYHFSEKRGLPFFVVCALIRANMVLIRTTLFQLYDMGLGSSFHQVLRFPPRVTTG